jgi:hypothetical protein
MHRFLLLRRVSRHLPEPRRIVDVALARCQKGLVD